MRNLIVDNGQSELRFRWHCVSVPRAYLAANPTYWCSDLKRLKLMGVSYFQLGFVLPDGMNVHPRQQTLHMSGRSVSQYGHPRPKRLGACHVTHNQCMDVYLSGPSHLVVLG